MEARSAMHFPGFIWRYETKKNQFIKLSESIYFQTQSDDETNIIPNNKCANEHMYYMKNRKNNLRIEKTKDHDTIVEFRLLFHVCPFKVVTAKFIWNP